MLGFCNSDGFRCTATLIKNINNSYSTYMYNVVAIQILECVFI